MPGLVGVPDLSPDGRFVAFIQQAGGGVALRVARLEDGRPTACFVRLPPEAFVKIGALGRARWLPGGRAIAFLGLDEHGNTGVYRQDFDPDRDTGASRRKLAGFDPDFMIETFAISIDGKRMTLAGSEQISSVLIAEPIAGIEPATRMPQ